MTKSLFYTILIVLAVGTVSHVGYAWLKWGPYFAVPVALLLLGLGHWFIHKVGPHVS